MTYHPKTKRKKKILTKIRVGEVSAVKIPANEHALATIMKGALPLVVSDPYKDEVMRKRAGLTTVSSGHTHLVHVDSFDGNESNSGSTSWEDDHSHPWVRVEDGTIKIGKADGHSHSIAVMGKNTPEAAQPAATEGLTKPGDDENNNMTPEEIQKQKEEFDAMQKRAEAAEKLSELNDAQREYRKSLDSDEARSEFVNKSDEDRQSDVDAKIAKAAESDPVVCEFEGKPVRKSQDPSGAIQAMAKKLGEQADELKKSREETEEIAFAKQAQDELSNTVGDEDVKVTLLKCVARVASAEMRGKVRALLKAADGAFRALTKSEGHGGVTVDTNSAEAQLDTLAKKIAAEENCTKPQGMAKALRTPEGEALYAQKNAEALV